MTRANAADHRLRGLRYFAALGAVAVAHCLLGVFLYARLSNPHRVVAEPYWFTFLAPSAAGFVGYWLVFRGSPWIRFTAMPTRVAPFVVRQILLLLLAVCAVLFSSYIYMLFALNIYGS